MADAGVVDLYPHLIGFWRRDLDVFENEVLAGIPGHGGFAGDGLAFGGRHGAGEEEEEDGKGSTAAGSCEGACSWLDGFSNCRKQTRVSIDDDALARNSRKRGGVGQTRTTGYRTTNAFY